MTPVKKTKPEQPITDKAVKDITGSETCVPDAPVCPCFPHINIEHHITSGNVPKK